MAHDPRARLYQWLTDDEDARVCRDISEAACDEQPRNYGSHLLALTLTKVGDKLVDPKIVLSWLITALGASPAYLSWLVPIREGASLLPQLLVAARIRALTRRKWLWCAGSIAQAVSLLGMAVAALRLSGDPAAIAILLLLLVFSLARGVCSVTHKDVLGKTVAKSRRGSLSGYAESLAGFIALGIATWLIVDGQRSVAIAVLFLLVAALLWLVAALVYAGLREQAGATEGGGNALQVALQQLRALGDDPQLGRFVAVRALLLGSALSAPFVVGLSQAAAQSWVTSLGGLLLAGSLASFCSGPIWGRLSDRSSRRTLIVAGALAGLTGLGIAVCAALNPNWVWSYPLALFVLYVAHAGVRIGRKTHLVDMAGADNRAAYVAVSNTAIGVVLVLLAGFGAVAESWQPGAALVLYATMTLLGAGLAFSLAEVQ